MGYNNPGQRDIGITRTASRQTRIGAVDLLILAALAAAGLALWLWVDRIGDAEAWDYDEFWSIALPAMAALSAIAGFIRPRVAVFAGAALVIPQAIALFGSSGFAPLALAGVIFFVVFAIGFTVVAIMTSRLQDWLGHRRKG